MITSIAPYKKLSARMFDDFFDYSPFNYENIGRETFGSNTVEIKDGRLKANVIMYGIKKEDITLEYINKHIKINVKGKGDYYVIVGKDIDEESLDAKLEDGILTIIGKEKNYINKKIQIK